MKKLLLSIALVFAFAGSGLASEMSAPTIVEASEFEQALQLVGINSVVVVTTSSTVTVPSGVNVAWVCVQAGGGGGGGGSGYTEGYNTGGGGGGSSGQSICAYQSVTPGASITVTIGGGGASGTAGSSGGSAGGNGGAGSNTSFGSFTTSVPGAGGIGGASDSNLIFAQGGSYDGTSVDKSPAGLYCPNCSNQFAANNTTALSSNAYQSAANTVGATPTGTLGSSQFPLYVMNPGSAMTGAMSAPGGFGTRDCSLSSLYAANINPSNNTNGYSGASIPPYYGGAAGGGGGGGASIFGKGGAGGAACNAAGTAGAAATGAGGGGGDGAANVGGSTGGAGGAGGSGVVEIVWISGSN